MLLSTMKIYLVEVLPIHLHYLILDEQLERIHRHRSFIATTSKMRCSFSYYHVLHHICVSVLDLGAGPITLLTLQKAFLLHSIDAKAVHHFYTCLHLHAVHSCIAQKSDILLHITIINELPKNECHEFIPISHT